MRKLKIMEHISLDGVIQSSGEDNFPYSDWTVPYRTPAGRDALLAAHGEKFDLLLGRRTYDMWSGFWPKAPSSPMADGLNAATKYTATHRPESLAWGPFENLGPDIHEGVRRIKSQDGPDLILWGSSTLTSTLLEYGLADEVLLVVYPVLVGTGKRFFAEGTPARTFELVSTNVTPTGIIELTLYPLFTALAKGLTIRAYTLFEITSDPVFPKAKQSIFDHLASGAFKPLIDKTFRFAEIVEAHRYMESNAQIGKIVVTL